MPSGAISAKLPRKLCHGENPACIPSHPKTGQGWPRPPPGPGRTPCSRSQGGTGFLEIPKIRMHFVKQLPEMLQDLRV